MDGLSAAASVAGIAAVGVQLSKSLYDVITTINDGKEEIRDIADNVSLLAYVLEQLQDVLSREKLHFRPALEENANIIVSRCDSIFKDIKKHTRGSKGDTPSKLVWYFKRSRVKPLRASLESLKSTLNILLHIIQLAKTTQEALDSPAKDRKERMIFSERRSLVYHVIDNRLSVAKLKILEQEVLQEKPELDLDGLPYIYDGSSPLPDIFHHKKPESERAFDIDEQAEYVFATTSRSHGGNRRSRSRQRLDRPSNVRSHSQGTQNGLENLTVNGDHGGRNFVLQNRDARSASPHGRKSESKSRSQGPNFVARSLPHPLTSTLIMSVIPHEKADKAVESRKPNSESEGLKMKAETTIDFLLEDWTNVGPRKLSATNAQATGNALAPPLAEPQPKSAESRNQSKEKKSISDKSSVPSFSEDTESVQVVEASSTGLPEELADDSEGIPEVRGFNMDDSSSALGVLGKASQFAQKGHEDRPSGRQRVIVEEQRQRPNARGRTTQRERRPPARIDRAPPPPPSEPPKPQYSYEPLATYNSYGYPGYPVQAQYAHPPYFATAPTNRLPPPPAPAQPSVPASIPHPSLAPVAQAASISTPPPTPSSPPNPVVNLTIDKSHLDSEERSDFKSADKRFDTVEKILGILERPLLDRGAMEAKHRQLEEELRLKTAIEQINQKAVAAEKAEENSKPITLQDCLGRRFVFPLEMCRSWWVSVHTSQLYYDHKPNSSSGNGKPSSPSLHSRRRYRLQSLQKRIRPRLFQRRNHPPRNLGATDQAWLGRRDASMAEFRLRGSE